MKNNCSNEIDDGIFTQKHFVIMCFEGGILKWLKGLAKSHEITFSVLQDGKNRGVLQIFLV